MNKTELVSDVAAQLNMKQVDVARVVDQILAVFASHFISGGQTITLRGLGTFSRRYRDGYYMKSIYKDGPIWVPARSSLHFKPSGELVSRINL